MSASSPALKNAQARIGTLLGGKWHLRRVLGSGGMATVFVAVHRNKKRAAIKMLHPELSLNTNIRDRFLREGYVANSIDHPGVVRVDDDDVAEDGAAYIVMELLRGEPLDVRAERLGGILPLDEVTALTDQLLGVLAAAHAAHVVHRDLKPENLFLTTEGQLKVLDFGIARLREVSSPGQRTSVGSFMGTPSFMSPEQALGRWNEVDERSDIWAVGATMYTLLTDCPVHDAETVNEQLVLAATAAAPSLQLKRPDLPDSIVLLVDKALAHAPKDRWQSALEMQAALRTVAPTAAGAGPRAPEEPLDSAVDASFPTPAPATSSLPTDPTLVSRRGTVAALSTSVPADDPGASVSPNRRRRFVLFGAIGVVAALIVAAAWLPTARKESPESPGAGPAAQAPPASAAPVPSEAPTTAVATVAPAETAAPSGSVSAASPPVSKAPASPRAAAPVPTRTKARPPAGAPAPKTGPATSDPFDKRF